MQEIQSKKTQIISERRAFKKSAKDLYCGRFLQKDGGEESKKQSILKSFEEWQNKPTWYLTEVKGGVQAFTSERGIDFSIRQTITEEYLQKIKENKVEPPENPRDILPIHVVASIGLAGLIAANPSLLETPMELQALIIGVIILLAISHEVQRMKVNKAQDEVIEKLNKGN